MTRSCTPATARGREWLPASGRAGGAARGCGDAPPPPAGPRRGPGPGRVRVRVSGESRPGSRVRAYTGDPGRPVRLPGPRSCTSIPANARAAAAARSCAAGPRSPSLCRSPRHCPSLCRSPRHCPSLCRSPRHCGVLFKNGCLGRCRRRRHHGRAYRQNVRALKPLGLMPERII